LAQHDYNIANQTAPTFRADLNLLLDAIVSNNSGATAPSTTFANMFWYDTTTSLMKQRNEANSAWVTLELTPTILVSLTQTQAEDAASTVFGQVSGQRLSQAIAEQAIGVGQTWQDVASSRFANTSYQNTTGKAIMILIRYGDGNDAQLQVSSNNSTWLSVQSANNNQDGNMSAIIPDGYYYRITAGIPGLIWVELR